MRPMCEPWHLSYDYDFPKKKMVRQICSDYIALEVICIWRHCLQGKRQENHSGASSSYLRFRGAVSAL